MSNSFEEKLELLRSDGDPIEQTICQDTEGILPILYPYASIWADHIYVRRLPDNPTRVPDDWMRFAGSHYTSLVRAYLAHKKLPEIKQICELFAAKKGNVDMLLRIHDLTAGFWWNLGASLDNLFRAATDAPPIIKRSYNPRDNAELNDVYNLRSQYIHSRLVVASPDADGLLHFNLELLEGKGADWSVNKYIPEYFEDFYPKRWQAFVVSAEKAWRKLQNILLDFDDERPTPKPEIKQPSRLSFTDYKPISMVKAGGFAFDYFNMGPSGVSGAR